MQSNLHKRSKSFTAATKIASRRQNKLNIRSPHTNNADYILQQARQLYHSQNNLEEAVRLFEQYLSVHPKHDQSLYLSAVAYLHLNNCQAAILKLSQISQDFENKANALLLLAMGHKRIGNSSRSLAIINECLRKYEDFQEALCFRGKLYLTMNLIEKAELDYIDATNLPNPSFPCLLGLGDCYRYRGKVQKALNAYQKSLQLIGKSTHLNEDSHKAEIQLKIAICKYRLERYEQSYAILTQLAKKNELKISELYYYMGQCEIKLGQREKGVLNLEYSLRLQTNMGIMQKAFKQLIQLHLEKHQYYEASNIASMQKKYELGLEIWSKTVESFMLIIKNEFQKGVKQLYDIYDTLKVSQSTKAFKKIIKETTDNEINFRKKISLKINNRLIVKRMLGSQSPKPEFNKNSKRMNFFSTKSVTKASKIESNRIHLNPLTFKLPENSKFKTEHSPQSQESQKKQSISVFSVKERQFIYPLILQFKAYGEFFMEKYVSCVQTYEQYDTFLKEVLGKESDVQYNRNLSEGLLIDGEMPDQALQKYSNCVNIYYNQYNTVPPQPILYKISLLLRMAIIRNNLKQDESYQQDASYEEILESTMQIIKNYDITIGQHYMLHYFKAIILILMQKFDLAKDSLDKTMVLANECSWKILFVKGVLEMQLGHYASAVKEFSAGLLIEIKPELYLARSITFLLLSKTTSNSKSSPVLRSLMKSIELVNHISEKSSNRDSEQQFNNLKDTCLQKCFDDLQNFIEHSDNQEDISLWVSKILFTTHSYDEASNALSKLNFQTEQVLEMVQCLQIYEGEFQKGGQVGLIIKSAFDGEFLTEEEELKLFDTNIIKNYNSFVYGYLTEDYEKWLIIMQLYMKKDYKLLIRYIQRQLLSCEDEQLQVLLRYDLAVLYFFMGQQNKAVHVIKTMGKYDTIFNIKEWIDKVLNYEFTQDECLSQLRSQIRLPYAKLLSSYLPYQSVEISKQDKKIKIFMRPCIPWPKFKEPDLKLKLSGLFIVEELSSSRIPKCLEAPWLVKVNNMVQFTENLLDESISSDVELQNPTIQ